MRAAMSLRRRPHRVAADDSGFALLEVLVAAVLFAIVAASATLAIAKSISVSNTTRNRVTATGLAAAAVSQARADTTSLMATPTSTTTPAGGYTVERTATIPVVNGIRCPAGQTIPLTVTVRQSGNSLVRIDTVIAC